MNEIKKIWRDTLTYNGKYSQKRVMIFSCFWLAVLWGSYQLYVWHSTGQEPNTTLVATLIAGAMVGSGINVKDKIESRKINVDD